MAWHILKNAVCFEHSKCTHIDRCSRLLSPSPANTEAHTRVVIIGLEEWDKNRPFLLFFFFFFCPCTIRYFAFFPFFSGSENAAAEKRRWKDEKKRAWQWKERDETEWEGERIHGGWQQRNERTFTEADPKNQFNHPNWKYTCQESAWYIEGVTVLCWNVYQDVKQLKPQGWTMIHFQVVKCGHDIDM